MKPEKTFTIRIDLESDKGIKAVPRFLDLLKKYNIKASFYLTMGGESNIIDLFRYRKSLKSSDERKIKVWSLRDKFRMALLPKDFVRSNKEILKRILLEGHELGIHGWKHREWTRGLESINIRKALDKSIKKYVLLFGKNPESFAAPGFNTTKEVLEALENKQIKFISDFDGDSPRYYGKMKNVPITICGKNKTPIIEYLSSSGKSDEEISEKIKENISESNLASLYIHGLFEIRFKMNILEEIFKFVKSKKIKTKRIIDY